ncbi:MAG: NAD(+) salvage pathway protein [Phylliscum demangeonii]|nr:MAG: NAD(+) salvage pathway protein [Phylliscum demangeonii]
MNAEDHSTDFRPALLIVDLQEDFCPPVRQDDASQRSGDAYRRLTDGHDGEQHGALAVPGGREVASIANDLLELPFVIKIASKDWHPADHVSFARNHAAAHHEPFLSTVGIRNPLNEREQWPCRLWPAHCVQGTAGAQLLAELHVARLDHTVEKGREPGLEMFSAFRSPFRDPPMAATELAALLRDARVTHVYTVGLAMDYCVRCTALDAAHEGFTTYVVREGTRAVAGHAAFQEAERALRAAGVRVIDFDGVELARVRRRG